MRELDDGDDFGDLYADVEVRASSAINAVHGFSQFSTEDDDSLNNAVQNCIVGETTESNNFDFSKIDGEYAPLDADIVEAVAEADEAEAERSSESEDDLNIVLNDDDADVNMNAKVYNNVNNFDDGINVNYTVSNGVGLNDEVNEEAIERRANVMKQNWNGGKDVSGYSLHYKNIKLHTPAFPNDLEGYESAGITSYSSTSARGSREDNCYTHGMGASTLSSHRGHNFSVPRSRTILDVNIDSFEQKPWRHPGVNLTDYFNFGLNEDSWKHYCNRLDTIRHQTCRTTYSCSSSRHKKEFEVRVERQETAQEVGAGIGAHPVYQHSEVISGSAIQVEECVTERQPSTDIRRQFDRDSDVVIQIAVQQDLAEDCLTSAIECLNQIEAGNESTGVDEARDALCLSSTSEDEQFSLEGHGDGLDNTVAERSCKQTPATGPVSIHSNNDFESVQMSEAYEAHHEPWTDSFGTAEEVDAFDDTGNTAEKVIPSAAPSIVAPEPYHGGCSPRNSLSSSPCSNLEPSNGNYADRRGFDNKSMLNSPNSMTEVRATHDCYLPENSKNYSGRSNPRGHTFHSRSRSSTHNDVNFYKSRSVDKYDEDASHLFEKQGFCDSRRSAVTCKRQSGINYYGGKNKSCHEGSQHISEYGDHKFPNYDIRDGHTKMPNWRGHSSFGYEMGQRRNMNGNKNHSERRSRVGHKERRQCICYDEWRPAVQYMEYPSHDESRKWASISNRDYDDGTCWKIIEDDWKLLEDNRKSVKNDVFLLQSNHENKSMRQNNRKPVHYVDTVRSSFPQKYDKHLSYTRGDITSPSRSSRKCDSSFGGAHYIEYDVETERCTRLHSLGSQKRSRSTSRQRWQGALSPKGVMYLCHSRDVRNKRVDRNYKNNWLGHHDVFDNDINLMSVDDQDLFVRRHHEKSGTLRWIEEQYEYEPQNNEVHCSSGPRRCYSLHRTNRFGKHIEDRQVGQGGFRSNTEEHRGPQCHQDTNFLHRDNYGETFPRFRHTVGSTLKCSDRKSSGRGRQAGNIFRASYEHTEYDQSNWASPVAQAENLEVKTYQKGQHHSGKFPNIKLNEPQDIEEGQIIAEEVNERAIEEISSEGLGLIAENKNLPPKCAVNGNEAFEAHENPRIREIIAKMEKRRERFKQPISVKINAEKASLAVANSVVETYNSNPQRPARKRRWNGS